MCWQHASSGTHGIIDEDNSEEEEEDIVSLEVMTRLNEYGGALDTIQQGRLQEKHQAADLHTEGTLSMYKKIHHREEHCATEIAECIGCKRHTLFSKAQSKEEHCEHSQTQYYLR